MNIKLHMYGSRIKKGETEGAAVYNQNGGGLRFIRFPIDSAGRIALDSLVMGFEGSMDGRAFFSINDTSGTVYAIKVKAFNGVAHIDNYPDSDRGAVLPIAEPRLFEGLPFIRPKLGKPESADRVLELFFD